MLFLSVDNGPYPSGVNFSSKIKAESTRGREGLCEQNDGEKADEFVKEKREKGKPGRSKGGGVEKDQDEDKRGDGEVLSDSRKKRLSMDEKGNEKREKDKRSVKVVVRDKFDTSFDSARNCENSEKTKKGDKMRLSKKDVREDSTGDKTDKCGKGDDGEKVEKEGERGNKFRFEKDREDGTCEKGDRREQSDHEKGERLEHEDPREKGDKGEKKKKKKK
eukprot:TRINITY_DN4545_c0_g4_i2.p2 TRINITY_DN4545_c0_g4~~TRINITY_DN4545_c0_g4_i2.p2  ORF type:complete len:219 (-),score=79.59 TRINITY_DN4545_c0_g4_i2:85-741(-)